MLPAACARGAASNNHEQIPSSLPSTPADSNLTKPQSQPQEALVSTRTPLRCSCSQLSIVCRFATFPYRSATTSPGLPQTPAGCAFLPFATEHLSSLHETPMSRTETPLGSQSDDWDSLFVSDDEAPVGDSRVPELSLSDFDLHGTDGYMKDVAERLVLHFLDLRRYMVPILAQHLAKSTVKIWEKCKTEPSSANTIAEMIARLEGTGTTTQELYYPYWFFLSVRIGSGEEDISNARRDMSVLWGAEFPIHDVTYPKHVPVELQMRQFFGIKGDANDAESMTKLAQCLELLIETTPFAQVSDMVAHQLPASSLRDRTEQLQETRKELKQTRKELKQTREELKLARAELDALARSQAETKDKAEKALRISAMLLGTHLSPGSNKRKRGSNDNEL
ncbi:hypothetical protein FDECE_4073 [Fusarium decemcellulare]|nr:hypothetical protein FDECE_4073 [Fusarium decemcellulare]